MQRIGRVSGTLKQRKGAIPDQNRASKKDAKNSKKVSTGPIWP